MLIVIVHSPRHHRALIQGIEGLLQENLRYRYIPLIKIYLYLYWILVLHNNVVFRFGGTVGGLNVGWGGDMDASREFKPVPKLLGYGRLLTLSSSTPQSCLAVLMLFSSRRPRPFLTDESGGRDPDTPPPMPRIIIRAVGLVAVIKVSPTLFVFYYTFQMILRRFFIS